jgi:hypothetical protein
MELRKKCKKIKKECVLREFGKPRGADQVMILLISVPYS